jgi:hypothetical protein
MRNRMKPRATKRSNGKVVSFTQIKLCMPLVGWMPYRVRTLFNSMKEIYFVALLVPVAMTPLNLIICHGANISSCPSE